MYQLYQISLKEFKIDIESGQEGSELIGNIITELASVNTFFQGLVGYWDKKVEESGVVSEQDIEIIMSTKQNVLYTKARGQRSCGPLPTLTDQRPQSQLWAL